MAKNDSTAARPRVKDISGQQFHDLTAISYAGTNLGSQAGAYWTFRCVCGTEKILNGRAVRSGSTKSCGCSKQRTDETGNKYEKLTVIEFAGNTNSGDSLWICMCECGKNKTIARGELRKGSTKSCGCHRASAGGRCNTSEYTSWQEMKRRCEPDYKDKHLYADRGITLCERWKISFNNFFKDMGPKPFPEATIDRINNDLGYSPDNCRWATKTEQSQNTRKARMLTYNGETLCLREWARRLGINHSTLISRINKGWAPEKIFSPEHYFVPHPRKRRKN